MTFGADIHGTQRTNYNDLVDASIATSTRWIETSVFPGETWQDFLFYRKHVNMPKSKT